MLFFVFSGFRVYRALGCRVQEMGFRFQSADWGRYCGFTLRPTKALERYTGWALGVSAYLKLTELRALL